MQAPKPTGFLLLLEVFRRGLILDLVSRNDVTSWADEIILNTDEPDYFFIELSLCTTTNHLIEVIGAHVKDSDNPICSRVLLGLIYRKLTDNAEPLDIETAAMLIGRLQSFDTLKPFEDNEMYMFDDYDLYYAPDLVELQIHISEFLHVYDQFTLTNYEEWAEVNNQLELFLTQKQTEEDIRLAAITQEWEAKNKSFIKQLKKQKLKRYLNIGILIAVIAAILLCAYFSPATEINWGSIVGTVLICGLFIGKEYMLRGRRSR